MPSVPVDTDFASSEAILGGYNVNLIHAHRKIAMNNIIKHCLLYEFAPEIDEDPSLQLSPLSTRSIATSAQE